MRALKRSRRSGLCAAAAAAAFSAASQPALATVGPDGDPALYWNQVLSTGISGPPVFQTRTYAMVSTAIYDAVNATSGFTNYSYVKGVPTSGGDTRAATAIAAYNVLSTLNPAKTADYAQARDASLALVADGAAKANGIATGNAVSAAILAHRANDGSNAPSSYTPTPGVGNWQPTPPANADALGAQWGDQTTWVINSGDQFRPPPPPNIGTAAYAAAYNEVMAIGSVNSATRTQPQTDAANFWATTPPSQWAAAGVAVAETANLSTIENARLFALLHTSIADALIGVWDSKFEFDLWRPITAIRSDDGDPATLQDVGWTSLLTNPPYPAYASGLSGVNGAASTILDAFFGDGVNFCMTGTVGQRCFNSFTGAGAEGAESRLWGGIHFRFDNEAGLLLGQQVANFTLASTAFDAVPEPGAWAMMILGFGLAGAVLRRRAAAGVAPA
jgi:hypothetical protein